MIDLKIDFNKFSDGLVPAIIQDHQTSKVLMLGYMNQDAFNETMASARITFYSRSKKRLWTKGEESGNFLELKSVASDCDADALLFKVHPVGPVCHTGADTCWDEKNHAEDFLSYLEDVIELRKNSKDENSYVKTLLAKGINKVAQKVGEEAVRRSSRSRTMSHFTYLRGTGGRRRQGCRLRGCGDQTHAWGSRR